MNLKPYEKIIISHLGAGLSQKEVSATMNTAITNVNNILRRARIRNNMKTTIQLVSEARLKQIV